jgi:hypothetical protein
VQKHFFCNWRYNSYTNQIQLCYAPRCQRKHRTPDDRVRSH